MLIAPHPDDESLACSIVLQRAVRAGAHVRVVYATDGENNPWPQRVLERKWRLDELDRGRWGRLRRQEALNALSALGIDESQVEFLALPDQGLTGLLLSDVTPSLQLLTDCILNWAPTDLFWPALGDTHPDHSALAVMMFLTVGDLRPHFQVSAWNFLVHGNDPEFSRRAFMLEATAEETAVKRAAIHCHKTQLKLCRRRFLGYATRPERLAQVNEWSDQGTVEPFAEPCGRPCEATIAIPPMRRRLLPAEPRLFIVGYDMSRRLIATFATLVESSSQAELFDCRLGDAIAVLPCENNSLGGVHVSIPPAIFSSERPLYIKLQRRGIFFDEAGWIQVPARARALQLPAVESAADRSMAEEATTTKGDDSNQTGVLATEVTSGLGS
jgi:LmbE family N-acetylglucosaminyl deacetylase